MIDIEELAKQLRNSAFFKEMLREEVKDCLMDLRSQKEADEITLTGLTQQISSHLAAITEIALEEDNSHNFLTFMKRNQEMYSQIQKRVEQEMSLRVRELQKNIEELEQRLDQLTKSLRNSNNLRSQTSKLKTERKIITKAIIDTNRIINTPKSKVTILTPKSKSTIDPRRMFKNQNFNTDQNQQMQMIDTNDSHLSKQLDGSSLPLSSDKQNSVCFIQSVKKEMERMKCQNSKLSEQNRHLTTKLQSKLQTNLEGVWNVIGDLMNRISKLQTLQSVIDICER